MNDEFYEEFKNSIGMAGDRGVASISKYLVIRIGTKILQEAKLKKSDRLRVFLYNPNKFKGIIYRSRLGNNFLTSSSKPWKDVSVRLQVKSPFKKRFCSFGDLRDNEFTVFYYEIEFDVSRFFCEGERYKCDCK